MKIDVTRMIGELSPSEADTAGAPRAAPPEPRAIADERRSEGRREAALPRERPEPLQGH